MNAVADETVVTACGHLRLIVIRQCAVARRVVAPWRAARPRPGG